jgi:glycosyltransferase involved in cell wall biosynthesis
VPARALLLAEAAALRRLERRLLRVADIVSVVSETDRARLPPTRGRVIVCPNGHEHPELLPWRTNEPTAVFVAQLGWKPNVDGALWLGRKVWPLVRAVRPDARLLLVGRQPAPAVRGLAGPDVEVTGTVPDAQPFLARARCTVAPLSAGGGSRLKILESLAAGRPVVSTRVGAEGLDDLVSHGIVIADDPRSFANAVIALLDDANLAEQVGKEGHSRVAKRYTWDKTLAPLLNAVFAANH